VEAARRGETGRVGVSGMSRQAGNSAVVLLVRPISLLVQVILLTWLERCFCGVIQNPKPPRLSTPHSCSNSCSRHRACGHPCPLPCHPGPCPPCRITRQLPCHCGKQTISMRCSHALASKSPSMPVVNLSCERQCQKRLSCGNHVCKEICHGGPCTPCAVKQTARCWCGKSDMELDCGAGDDRDCVIRIDSTVDRWVGKFDCGNTCDRYALLQLCSWCHPNTQRV